MIFILKKLVQKIINDYNKDIQYVNLYDGAESDNLYGHVRKFMILPKNIKRDAHRVISPFELKLAGIEEVYSVRDINGNLYDFEIFSDGNYRIYEVEKFKDIDKEVADEKYFKANS